MRISATSSVRFSQSRGAGAGSDTASPPPFGLENVNCHAGRRVYAHVSTGESRGTGRGGGTVNVVRRMARRSVRAAAVVAGSMMTLAGAQAGPSSDAIVLPSDADIRKVLAERVDALARQQDGVGIVIGVSGRRVA